MPIEFVKILIALALGLGIGLERSLVHKTAGMRTYGLVSMGACLFIILSQLAGLANTHYVAAAIITGIGFLCGGVIIFANQQLTGLTTAAGLWLTAAIGMAVGFGEIAIAIFATATMLIVLSVLWTVENKITARNAERSG